MDTAPTPEDTAPEQQAVQEVLKLYFGQVAAQTLHVAVRLGLPDALAIGPSSTATLARTTETHAPTLGRLLRALAGLGIVVETAPDEFVLTARGTPLRSDVPHSVHAMVELFSRPALYRAWEELPESVRTGQHAFERSTGQTFYEYCRSDADLSALLRTELTQESSVVARVLPERYDFAAHRIIVDVGGGTGGVLSAVLAAHPAMRGILFDSASGSDPSEAVLREAGVDDRCTRVVGDFFESVPPGGDLYLLKSVIQDWDDDRAAVLLRTCRQTMPSHARLLLVEHVRGELTRAGSELPLRDMVLLAISGGRVRTEAEFAALLAEAGFVHTTTTPLTSSYDLIEATLDGSGR